MDTIHHIAIQASDIKTALDWYQTIFDVKVSYQDESWPLIEFENVASALVIPRQPPLSRSNQTMRKISVN